jgi:hypothetical protein
VAADGAPPRRSEVPRAQRLDSEHEWIVSAIYVPDYDPASSIYAAVLDTESKNDLRLTREFYTATGMIRYTYDPRRLLTQQSVLNAIRQNPMAPAATRPKKGLGIEQAAKIALVQGQPQGVATLEDGFAAVVRLAAPLDALGVRAVVLTEYVGGTGWQNQRLLSLLVSLLALVLLGVGAALAWRGMHKGSGDDEAAQRAHRESRTSSARRSR